MREYHELMAEHQALQKQLDKQPDAVEIEQVLQLVAQARDAGEYIEDPRQREQLRAILRHWGAYVYDHTGEYPATQLTPYDPRRARKGKKPALRVRVARWWNERDRRAKVALTVLPGLIVLASCIVVALAGDTAILPFMSKPTPTTAPPISVVPTTAIVTLTPTPTDIPTPTKTPLPTPTSAETNTPTPGPTGTEPPTPTPTTKPTLEATVPSPADPRGDVGIYESGAPVEGVPAGVDIRDASVGTDLRVVLQPTEGVPAELSGWAAEDEVLLWISLYEPVPDPPTVFTDWVFMLDLDGDVATGRPAGEVRANPDLGYEAAIGVSYNDASGKYESYFLVWNPAQANLVPQSEEPRFTLSEARTLIGLALALETLTQSVAETTNVTTVPEDVKGRAAVQSRAGGQRVIDFCPDRPD